MEGRAVGKLHHAHPAVRLHPGQERHGFRHDHRRHGHPLHRQRRRLLPRVQRLGLHAPGQPSARERAHGHRHGGEEDPHALPPRLRRVHHARAARAEQAQREGRRQQRGAEGLRGAGRGGHHHRQPEQRQGHRPGRDRQPPAEALSRLRCAQLRHEPALEAARGVHAGAHHQGSQLGHRGARRGRGAPREGGEARARRESREGREGCEGDWSRRGCRRRVRVRRGGGRD